MTGPEAYQWLRHIQLVDSARRLLSVVGRLARKDHLAGVAALLEQVAGSTADSSHTSDNLALIASLVLKDHESPATRNSDSWSAAGCEALQMLKAAVFPDAQQTMELSELVRCTTVEHAEAVCSICHEMLLDVLCDSGTCIPMLLAAEGQRWQALESRCLDVAVADVQSLGAELPRLPQRLLMRILGSDHLQVQSEMDVWHLLAGWLDARSPWQPRDMPTFLTEGVRLLQLTRNQLDEMDTHPAVQRCGTSSRLVAAAYLHASGHCGTLCSQLVPLALWRRLTAAGPRLCLGPKAATPAEPVTPVQAARAAPVATPLTDLSDDGAASPPSGVLADAVPIMRIEAAPSPQATAAMEILTLTVADDWLISGEHWEDITDTACDKIDLARHLKRLRRA